MSVTAFNNQIVNTIPGDALALICRPLSISAVGRVSNVCTSWNRIMNQESPLWQRLHLSTLFPGLIEIGPKEWAENVDLEKYELDVRLIRNVINYVTIRALKLLFDEVEIKDDGKFVVLTLPKGLTTEKLMKINQEPREGSRRPFLINVERKCADLLLRKVDEITETYQVVISNGILTGTLGKDCATQCKIAEERGGSIPEAMPAMTLAIFTKMSGKKCPSATRCLMKGNEDKLPNPVSEKEKDEFSRSKDRVRSLCVGGYKCGILGDGIGIRTRRKDFTSADLGAGLQWKFPPQKFGSV